MLRKQPKTQVINAIDITWAHRVLLFNLIIGRTDCGIGRFENSVVTSEGKFYEIDNEFIGIKITRQLTTHLTHKNEKLIKIDTHWTLLNSNIANTPFSSEVKKEFSQIQSATLFYKVEAKLMIPGIQENIKENLTKIQNCLCANIENNNYTPSDLQCDLSEG
ncbi:MAG: hypothetical protein KDK55_07140 [Chlamydiia bacterium]|nr:hypothetical protein [Chlamydiia bacterium]